MFGYRKWIFCFLITERSVIEVLLYIDQNTKLGMKPKIKLFYTINPYHIELLVLIKTICVLYTVLILIQISHRSGLIGRKY